MKQRYQNNPWLTAGLVMELIYLCTGHLAPVERMLGDHLGSFLCGVWQGITIALLLLGLLALASPDFRKKLEGICPLNKS